MRFKNRKRFCKSIAWFSPQVQYRGAMDRGIEWKSCEISRFEIGGAYPPHLRGVYLRGIWLQQMLARRTDLSGAFFKAWFGASQQVRGPVGKAFKVLEALGW